LNADGSLDNTFDPGSGTDQSILTLAMQPDGKILIGGNFASYNNITRSRIARLNANGSLDATFDPGFGANQKILTLSIQPDGKIIIGGEFTSYNGTARNRIARLNSDGSLDASFDPGSGADLSVRTISIQTDGNIIIGGDFTSYNDLGRNRLARIFGGQNLIPMITSFSATSAGFGASVTITGINFTGTSSVLFGGTPATSFVVVNSSTITAVVSAGTTGDVSVITPNGTATRAGFTYIPAPLVPTISSITPTSAGSGTLVTITGANFTNATSVNFGGINATSFTVVNSTTITAVVASGTSGSVSVTTPGGTASLAGFTFIAEPTITLLHKYWRPFSVLITNLHGVS
jgi:uncharacterized delta-60 repeat protein